MEITILFFGITHDIAGVNQQKLTVPEGTTGAGLLAVLHQHYPSLASINTLALAVNEEYSEYTHILSHHDVVALIPPVSGG